VSTRAGQLLIASSSLQDPNFANTVVLIISDDKSGTMGLVLNRPLATSVKEACEEVLEIPCEVESPLHQGGPVESLLTVLHTREAAGETKVIDGVYFTAEKEKILELMGDEDEPEVKAKYFAGYAGWGAGQLDAEIGTGAWLLVPAESRHVFGGDDNLWARLMTEVTLGKWVDPRRIPDDPSVN
jgi:putative transcriptional regulator